MPRAHDSKLHPAAPTREVDGELQMHCATCNTWWPASGEFFPDRDGKPGVLSNRCRACRCDYQAKSYQRRVGHRPTATPAMQTLADVPWLSATVVPPNLVHLFARSQA